MRMWMFVPGLVALCGTTLTGGIVFQNDFADPSALAGWNDPDGNGKIVRQPDGKNALEVTASPEDSAKGRILSFELNPGKFAGKRVRLSAEIAYETGKPLAPWQGAKLMLAAETSRGWSYTSSYFPPGKYDWHSVVRSADLPPGILKLRLILGVQSAAGRIRYRNLKVEAEDAVLDLSEAVNMGFSDPAAGDGKGGWTDQGPEKDAAKFQWKKKTFIGIPFKILDPGKNKGKSVAVFRSPHFRNGVERIVLNLENTETKGQWLYLLHTLAYGRSAGSFGQVILTDAAGRSQILNLQPGVDAADWRNPRKLANAFPAAYWTTPGLGSCGVYVSRFRLNAGSENLKSVEFRCGSGSAVWVLLAATISEKEYRFPEEQEYVVTAGREWKALPIRRQGILAGSALDRSFLNSPHEAGAFGRVVAGKSGHLEFEKRPGIPIRFFCSADGLDTFLGRYPVPAEIRSKEEIEAYVRQLRLHGYNMSRFHGVDLPLVRNRKKAGEFDPEFLDRLDYLIHCLKKNGIYINLDAMKSRIGYTPGNPYDLSDGRDFKFDLYFNASVRENWRSALKKLLTHRNPYTKMTLAEDPVLALIVGYNEQEFAFLRERDFSPARDEWNAFLKRKYRTIAAWKKAWKGEAAGKITEFGEIPVFSLSDMYAGGAKGTDVAEFISERETEMIDWFRRTLAEIGYKGLLSNFNMGKSLRHALVRRSCDLVTMNSYHAHPSHYNQSGSTIMQESSIGDAGNQIRGILANRLYGKPFLVTEHGHAFWNRYRYEQAFITGAYGAFQGFDGLTAFAQPVSVQTTSFINPFNIRFDPVLSAQEFLTAFLFLRRDVASAPRTVRMPLAESDVYSGHVHGDGVAGAQSRIGLLTGFSLDCGSSLPLRPDEIRLPRSGSAGVVVGGAYSSLAENGKNSFDLSAFVRELKHRGVLSPGNATNPEKEIYENSTGELLLNAPEHFMKVNTPRLQGICGEAGSRAKLENLEIVSMSVRGNLALVSVDGERSIDEAGRMVLVFSTDARNSGMTFTNRNARTLMKNGKAPVLVRTGTFTVRLHGRRNSDFRVFALRDDGSRLCELPLKKQNGVWELSCNTASFPNNVPIYFEWIRKGGK